MTARQYEGTPLAADAPDCAGRNGAHTPGPWEFYANDLGTGACAGTADVSHCSGFCSERSRAEEEANARLIAAAPELLEALREIDAFWTSSIPDGPHHTIDAIGRPRRMSDSTVELWCTIRAAIAKAEGRTDA